MTTHTFDRTAAMLPRLRTAAATVLIMLAVVGASLSYTPVLPASEAQRIAAIVDEVCDAFGRGDARALERLLADDYTLVSSRGEVSTKPQHLARARAGHAPTASRTRDVSVRIDGDTAFAIGVLAVRASDGAMVELRFTDVLVRRDGAWRMLATHVSRMS